jgi:hypothetical protein
VVGVCVQYRRNKMILTASIVIGLFVIVIVGGFLYLFFRNIDKIIIDLDDSMNN